MAFFPGETAAGKRAIGGHGDIIFSAQTEELSFIFTHNQVVVALHGNKGRQPFAFGKGVRFRKLPGIAIGYTNSAHFALSNGGMKRFKHLNNWRVVIPDVVNVEVDVVHPQILQALIERSGYCLFSADPRGNLRGGSRQKLGGQHHVLAFCHLPQRPANVSLAGAVLIGDGGIVKIDTLFETVADDVPACCFVQRPAMLAR